MGGHQRRLHDAAVDQVGEGLGGAPADVALLELRDGTFEFVDNYSNKITGRQRLFVTGTILAGKRIP